VSSDPTAPAAPAGPADGGGRRTDPGKREAERGGLSTVGQIATAAATIGGVAAAGVIWHQQVSNAIFGNTTTAAQQAAAQQAAAAQPAPTAPVAPAPPVPVDAPDESMDAFDAPPPGGGGGGGGHGGGAAAPAMARSAPTQAGPSVSQSTTTTSGGQASTSPSAPPDRPTGPSRVDPPAPSRVDPPAAPAGSSPATGISTQDLTPTPTPPADQEPSGVRPDPRPPSPDADATATPDPAPPTPTPDAPVVNPEFEATRATLAANLAGWEAPDGADPAEASALRDRLAALIDRFQPRPGQTAEDAVAELRDQVDLHIDNYVQGERIDALIEAQKADDAEEAAAAAAVDPAPAPPLVMTAPVPDLTDTIRPQLVDVFDEDAGLAPAAPIDPSGFPAGGGPKVAPVDPTLVDPVTGEGMDPVGVDPSDDDEGDALPADAGTPVVAPLPTADDGSADGPPLISLTDDALGVDQVTADVAAPSTVDPLLHAPIPGQDDDDDDDADSGADLDADPGAVTGPDDDLYSLPSDDPLAADPLGVDQDDPLSSGDFGDDTDDDGYQAPDDLDDLS
jgi:hypothetical protein